MNKENTINHICLLLAIIALLFSVGARQAGADIIEDARAFKAICDNPTESQRITIEAFFPTKNFDETCKRILDVYLNPSEEYEDIKLSLSFNADQVTDLSPLQHLSRLRSLGISRNPVTDLTPIANLKSLEYLNISYPWCIWINRKSCSQALNEYY